MGYKATGVRSIQVKIWRFGPYKMFSKYFFFRQGCVKLIYQIIEKHFYL